MVVWVPGRRAVLVSAALVVVVGVQAGTAWARSAIALVRAEAGAETLDDWRQDLQRSPVAERFGRLAFASAASDAIIVCDWEQATVLWYLQRVEGQRLDLTIRYPIERLDETLAEARTSGRTVYLSRTLPGLEFKGVTSSEGPLVRVFPPPSAGPVGAAPVARFEDGLTLTGLTQHLATLGPGSVLAFTVQWQAEARLAEAYAVSVRLISPSGAVLAVHDVRHPALGTSPTTGWSVGQLVGDYHELPIGSRLAPGTYQLQVIPYRVDPVSNLRRLDGSGQTTDQGISFDILVGQRAINGPLDLLTELPGLLTRGRAGE
jgi:hypothetical protein